MKQSSMQLDWLKGTFVLTALAGCCSSVPAATSCKATERLIWSCEAGQKQYVLCASGDLGPASGYLQYRVTRKGRLEFQYPSSTAHPKGLFRLALQPRGARLSFANAGYEYGIYEPLIGEAMIDVEREGRSFAEIRCSTSSEGLTLTSTQNFLKDVGIME